MPANYSRQDKREFARSMRKNPTPAERQLWYHLRENRLGYKFHRQSQVAGYIVDFYCPSARVAIEVDGSVHSMLIVANRDAEKERVLEERGVRVLRFPNEDVLGFIGVVITRIKSECDERRALKALSGANVGGGLPDPSSSRSCCAKPDWNSEEQQLVRAKLKEFAVQDGVNSKKKPMTDEDIAAINAAWRKLVRRSRVNSVMTSSESATDQKLRLQEWMKKRSESAALAVKGMHVTDTTRRQA